MTRSNKSSQSGYIKLQQESDIYEDEYIPWSDHDNNSNILYTKPRYHQKRSLSESIHPHVNFQIPRNRMEAISNENENDIAGNSSGIVSLNSNSSRADRSSAWSQFSKKLRLKGKNKRLDKSELEIFESVFKPVVISQFPSKPSLAPNHEESLTQQKFVEIVDSVKAAIGANIQPTRISQGSSGSYFCRNKKGKVVGVFKPKNEEPYGQLNPKWTKWIHRNLFPCFFGRSCLIPNLGYISESAASLLDQRLLLDIVPVTEVIWLSSPSFHYDYLDRRAARSKKNSKPLPDKIGSFQVFLNEYKDANIFLREHPWPENKNNNATTTVTDAAGNERHNRRLNALMCGRSGVDDDNGETSESYQLGRRFVWTPELQLQFREQFEKLVILDYLMRNTDRGFDNWMIKYCEKDEQTCIRNTPPTSSVMKAPDLLTKDNVSTHSKDNEAQGASGDVPPPLSPDGSEPCSSISEPPFHSDNQDKLDNSLSSISSPPSISSPTDFQQYKTLYPHIHVAAIDNGLAFPFKHPDQWRSYPYGWLYLPESLIGQPFTANTRNHFLPMLSDPKWWKETVNELRRLFELDTDFELGMFAKQMAVLKGQGWNIVETLKQPDQGLLDLCARQNVMVWDDVKIIEIPSEININTNGGLSTANDEDISSSVDGYFPSPPVPRRSLSEDNSGRTSLSASAPSSSQRWRDKIKEKLEKFNFDSAGKNKDMEEKKIKRVIVERLEPVKGGTPFFTCC